MERKPKIPSWTGRQVKLWRTLGLIFVGRLNQDHAGHFVRIKPVVYTDVQSTKRVADKHVRRRDSRSSKKLMQVLRDRDTRARKRSRITPAFSGSIVPAGACELGDFRLYLCLRSNITGRIPRGIQNNRRTAFSRAIDIQSPHTNID